jgi:hypothetical protein
VLRHAVGFVLSLYPSTGPKASILLPRQQMARSLGRDLPLHDKMAAQAGLPDQGGKFPAQPNQQKFSVMSQRAGNLGQDGCARDPLPGAAISLTLAAAKIPRPGARFRCGRSTGSAGTAFFSFLGWQNERGARKPRLLNLVFFFPARFSSALRPRRAPHREVLQKLP